MEIKFKTKDGSGIQGKQKVYLWCPPQDFDRWFDQAAGKILDLIDCAVVYADNDDGTALHDLLDDINLNLFVLLITDHALPFNQQSYERFLSYALQKKIPIFPMSFSFQNIDLFNQVTGDSHCFNAGDIDAKDETDQIIFDDKLRKALWERLASDENMLKIREAFSGYIFLSYRKKDYRYTKSFMELIHSDRAFRDVAVWFDEYLVPGEDFNLSIRQAMQKSRAFALLVTPNLLEKPNYVMDQEYPFAKEKSIPVFPFEFAVTDKWELSQKYANLPECIDARDRQAYKKVSQKISDALSCGEQNNSAEHLYLIGLAYLLGVDVEKNGPLAEELILRSARDGYQSGLKKLAEIYKEGISLPKNYGKAIDCLERYVKIVEKGFDQTEAEDQLESIVKIAAQNGDVSERQYQLYRQMEETVDVCSRLIELYDRTGRHPAEYYERVMGICRAILKIKGFFVFFMNTCNVITGYEKVKGADGKWSLGKAKYGIKHRLTGLIPDNTLAELCEKLILENSGKIDGALKSEFILTIKETFERMEKAAKKDQYERFVPYKSMLERTIRKYLSYI